MMVDGLMAPVMRSVYDHDTGTDAGNPRQQMNTITSLVDASQIYGSDSERLAALRTHEDGMMRLSGSDLLPVNTDGLENDEPFGGPLYLAGDVRANENVALTSYHTMFVREHNYWAERLGDEHRNWGDERIFKESRKIVETLVQKIAYEEFLPVLLGEDALPELSDSHEGVDTRIATEFSSAAFRFGHTMVSSEMNALREDGRVREEISLRDAFFTNEPVKKHGIDDFLRGIVATPAQAMDTKVVDDLNLFLFANGEMSGFSLPAINIMRGRDHGLGSYLEVREDLLGDVGDVESAGFDAISSDPAVQAALAGVYDRAADVDLWVGGLAADKARGAMVDPVFAAIITDQFTRLRDGDPLWHERRAWADEDLREAVYDTTLADIIMRSGGVDCMQRDVFHESYRMGGTGADEKLWGTGGRELMAGFGGDDLLAGRADEDDMFGGGGWDELRGGRGDDALYGGAGRDHMRGGRDEDMLSGGNGGDHLFGGCEADQFVFMAGETGVDKVWDFKGGEDLLVFKNYGIEFEDLRIDSNDVRTNIWLGDDRIAKVFAEVDEDDFLFIG